VKFAGADDGDYESVWGKIMILKRKATQSPSPAFFLDHLLQKKCPSLSVHTRNSVKYPFTQLTTIFLIAVHSIPGTGRAGELRFGVSGGPVM